MKIISVLIFSLIVCFACTHVSPRRQADPCLHADRLTLPTNFVIRDSSLVDMIDVLIEWYNNSTPPLKREISVVVSPGSVDSMRKIDAPSCTTQKDPFEDDGGRQIRKKTVDLSGLSINEAFKKIAEVFDFVVYRHNGVYYFTPQEK